ncbi:phosphoglycerol transferase MdoB-like AlkP superfamily enzyme [Paenibacillus shirakamiensis]|uniref:Phosphoglycerol transferase MdoB-like AlkP superfamily enzyme n=1 Tax=Paenibacillus shirakamiensis TaxID=1265935 RepID=A0ABS4JHZ5_9BACL|nr:LTA synthase family protein [Paenibacillus shirakamiensis]MBP2001328.1 phosphoglycerol transferase MdoB-like AlkP superfamily enzyme [Paenibacillus shirakamiensis]
MNATRNRFTSLLKKMLQHPLALYVLFLATMTWKLGYMHAHLHAQNIDMNRLDYIIAIGSLMLASFWTWWLPRKGRTTALILLNLALTALIYSDLVYYRYFGDFITIPVLFQVGQVGELGGSIRSLLRWTDLWFVIDWLLYLPMLFITLGRKNTIRLSSYLESSWVRVSFLRRTMKRLSSGLLVCLLGLGLTIFPIRHYTTTWAAGLLTGNWWNLALYNVTGLLGFHAHDTYNYAVGHWGPQKKLNSEQMSRVQAWYANAGILRSETPSSPTASYGAYKGSNVIVVQVEAFMNFMIGQKIGGQEITPHFNQLMKDSLYMPNYYHQTGQGRTSDADFSSQSSLHPLPTGSVFTRYPDHTYNVLPQILKDNGYQTAAFHAYESSFWNRYTVYKAFGYDQFYSKKDFTLDEPLGWSLGDKSFLHQSINKMKINQEHAGSAPFYSFLITLSSHHPYTLPEQVQELNVGEFQGTIFGNYLQAVHYVDEALGQMVEQLKQDGLWDRSILYIYGDHDNSIPDKTYYEKFLGRSLNELDMEQIMNQVPLLIHVPDSKIKGMDLRPGGQLDMAPSLLHLLGIPSQEFAMMGNDLFHSNPRFVVLRSGAFTDGTILYMPSADGIFEHGVCYDLATRQPTDVERARAGYTKAKQQLDYSDKTIEYDLIRKWTPAP